MLSLDHYPEHVLISRGWIEKGLYGPFCVTSEKCLIILFNCKIIQYNQSHVGPYFINEASETPEGPTKTEECTPLGSCGFVSSPRALQTRVHRDALLSKAWSLPESWESPGCPPVPYSCLPYSPAVAGGIWGNFPLVWVQKKIQTLVNLTVDFEPWNQLDDMVWLRTNACVFSTYPEQRVGLHSAKRTPYLPGLLAACVSPCGSGKEEMVLNLDWAQIILDSAIYH